MMQMSKRQVWRPRLRLRIPFRPHSPTSTLKFWPRQIPPRLISKTTLKCWCLAKNMGPISWLKQRASLEQPRRNHRPWPRPQPRLFLRDNLRLGTIKQPWSLSTTPPYRTLRSTRTHNHQPWPRQHFRRQKAQKSPTISRMKQQPKALLWMCWPFPGAKILIWPARSRTFPQLRIFTSFLWTTANTTWTIQSTAKSQNGKKLSLNMYFN